MDNPRGYSQLSPQRLIYKFEDWPRLLEKPLKERNLYGIEGTSLRFGQLVGRFLGTPLNETEYWNSLYSLRYESKIRVHVLDEQLDKTISADRLQAIQEVLLIHQKENGLSINRFVAFLKGYNLIPLSNHKWLHHQFQITIMELLKFFKANHPNGLLDPSFRRVIIDLIKWLWNYIALWIKEFSPEDVGLPKVLWYGDANQSEVYFLYFLILLGCDVLIFHPEGKDVLSDIDPQQQLTFIYRYPSQSPLEPFPKQKRKTESTIARRASIELDQMLDSEQSLLFKPWKLRNHIPIPLTLKTTYDEIFLTMKERALVRSGFEVIKNEVSIPCIFAKVAGISKDRSEYWSRLREFTDGELTVSVKQFPMTQEVKQNYYFHYQQSIGSEGKLSTQNIMAGNWWKYRYLPTGLQIGIAAAMARYCENPRLKRLPGENLEDVQLFLFKQAFSIPENMLRVLQKFDYPQLVPRLILYNTENNGTISRSDAALILLLNELSFDIVLFNPAGHNDLEVYIDDKHFDVHWLEEVAFGQEFPEKDPSFIQRIFKGLF